MREGRFCYGTWVSLDWASIGNLISGLPVLLQVSLDLQRYSNRSQSYLKSWATSFTSQSINQSTTSTHSFTARALYFFPALIYGAQVPKDGSEGICWYHSVLAVQLSSSICRSCNFTIGSTVLVFRCVKSSRTYSFSCRYIYTGTELVSVPVAVSARGF